MTDDFILIKTMSLQNIIKTTTPVCKHNDTDRSWRHLLIPPNVPIADLRIIVPDCTPAPLPPVIIDPAVFTLKKFESLQGHDGLAFNADLWFRKKKIARCRQDGNGGGTYIDAYPDCKAQLLEAQQWARALPPESSYMRLYEQMQVVSTEYKGMTETEVKEAWWCSNSAMDLEALVDEWCNRRAHRKSLRNLASRVIFGPCEKRAVNPVCLAYPKKPTDAQITRDMRGDGCKWASRYTEFIDLPFHYYPCPHPFASSLSPWAPRIRHISSRKEGKIDYQTTDDIVIMDIQDADGKSIEEIKGKPSEFEFVAALVAANQE